MAPAEWPWQAPGQYGMMAAADDLAVEAESNIDATATGGPTLNWIYAHFRRHFRRSPWSFVWRTAIEGTVLSLVLGMILSPFMQPERQDLVNMPAEQLIVLALLLAPVFETLIFQTIPIHLLRWFKTSFATQVAASTALFAAAHFPAGILTGLSAGIIGGFYLAITYAHWAKRDFPTAYVATTCSHFIRNLIAIGLLLGLRSMT